MVDGSRGNHFYQTMMILVLFMAFLKQKVTDRVTSPVIRLSWSDRRCAINITMGHNAQTPSSQTSQMEIIERVNHLLAPGLAWTILVGG